MTTGTDTLDRKMVNRYIECITAHPGAQMVIQDPRCPNLDCKATFVQVLDGRLTHLMVQIGPVLVVTWIESHQVQFLVDAYGETI